MDRFQRRHVLFGFPYAVWRKYSDDGGAMLAALLTYYGFLSVFPLLLVAVTLITEVLATQPALRHERVLSGDPHDVPDGAQGAHLPATADRPALARVVSAEVSAVHAYRLTPRGLGHAEPTAGDVRALTMRARAQERLPYERVSVSFGPTEEPPALTRRG